MFMRHIQALLGLLWLPVFLTGPAVLKASPPAGYYLVWSDEFNSANLDTTKWDYWLLGNRRYAVNVTNAVTLNGSNLVINTYTTGSTHYTAMVATDSTFRSRYGYWEANVKWGDTNGMWSAVWLQSPTMGTYLNDAFVSGSEIDVAEHRYVDNVPNSLANIVQNNVHWNGYGSAAKSAGSGNIGSGLASGFHTYGFQWTPTVYNILIDGSNLRSWSYANNAVPVSQSSEWMILSSEVDDTSTTWAGYIPSGGYGGLGTSTAKLTVDYVRYYAPTNTLFWTGASSAYWNNGGNWISNLQPAALSDLTFSYLSGNLSNVLGQDFTINSLVFLNLNNGVTINGANTLTIGAGGVDMVAANHSVSLNCPVTIGAAQTWTIGPNNPGNLLSLNGPLAGTAAFSKGGYGTVIINGTNTFSGTLNVDTGSGAANDGILRLTRNGNVANVPSPINIRNNNSGSSTLQIDGTLGSVTIPQGIYLAGRNTNVAAIVNYAGSNTIAGSFTLASGGANYWLDSDSGTLNLAGVIPASASVTSGRTLTFMGAANILVSGSITNANGYPVSMTKTNAGTLTLSGANYFTGTNRIAGGTEMVANSNALQSAWVDLNYADSGILTFGPVTSANIGGLTGLRDLWLTNSSAGGVALAAGNNGQSTSYDGALHGAGSLVKTGSGTLTLTGTNVYTGTTAVNAGVLRLGYNSNLVATLQPTLWFTFDQVGGGIVTNLGKGGATLNGTLVGTGAYVTNAGRYGNALYVNGAGGAAATNIVLVSDPAVTTDATASWTVGYWIKTTTAGAEIMYQGDGAWSSSGQTTFLLNANSASTAGTKAGAVRWAGGFLTGTTALNDGNWHFIALADKAGTESIYVDGVSQGVTSSMTQPLSTGANQLWIGGSPDTDAGAVKINGLIDEVYLFDRALSLTEIRSIYNNQPVLQSTNFAGKLPAVSPVTISSGAILDLGGISQNVVSLADGMGAGGLTNNSSVPVTLIISNNAVAATTFSGAIADASAANAISLVKAGDSSLTLAGGNNYRGTTILRSGTLIIDGSVGTNSVVQNGGVLSGAGILGGALTISAGTLAPGSSFSPGNTIGTLTVLNNVTLTAGSAVALELNKTLLTNDILRVSGTLNYGGTLNVSNLGGTLAANDSFKVFSAASTSGAFAQTNLPALAAGLGWVFNPVAGTLSVVQTVATNSVNIIATGLGGGVQLAWPADHTGWRLQVQTNPLSAGLGTNWFDLGGTAATNSWLVQPDTGNGSVFYRLIFP